MRWLATGWLALLAGPRQALAGGPADTASATEAVEAAGTANGEDTVVVLGERPGSALPMAASTVDAARIRAGELQVNLSESLAEVPGVVAQPRQNYAQDLQLSIRGFGARSAFGVRGVRLYADGIPATMPDGQGQLTHFDLAAAGRIEVLRGPYSALYGNASGGVVSITTREPDLGIHAGALLGIGSQGTRRLGFNWSEATPGHSLVVDAGRFETSGYREHGAARRDLANARAHWNLAGGADLALVANVLDLPEAQDPLGLTRAQWQRDPRQAGNNALAYDTRKSVGQAQLGSRYRRPLARGLRLEVMAYAGQRATRQFQSIPRAVEAAVASHPGGVIDLGRRYRGLDLRVTGGDDEAANDPHHRLHWAAGLSADGLDESRRGFLNYQGTTLGVIGELRRAEANRAWNLDEYAQARYESGGWLALAGVRHTDVHVRSRNGLDASQPLGIVDYGATSPMAGLVRALPRGASLWGAWGQGFETPTLNDLAYRSTDSSLPGPNLSLRPARSRHAELGLRSAAGSLQGSASVFQVDTRDELAVLASGGGRTVYQNIASTRRRGLELELAGDWAGRYAARLGWTLLDARTWTGGRLPGVPASSVGSRFEVRLAPATVVLEAQVRSGIAVDDRNSDFAGGYAVFNAHVDFHQDRGAWRFGESLRVDNLLDRAYVGSVIVNESNGRYFEPGPGRAFFVVLTAACRPTRR